MKPIGLIWLLLATVGLILAVDLVARWILRTVGRSWSARRQELAVLFDEARVWRLQRREAEAYPALPQTDVIMLAIDRRYDCLDARLVALQTELRERDNRILDALCTREDQAEA